MPAARAVAIAFLTLLATVPASAARPIVDLHKLDAYFALFAADSNVPWQTTSVRLDTYSSAPVRFSVYQIDPSDVLTAGSNARPRAIATRSLRPIIHFVFTPPGGYEFQPNRVTIPLGTREGFFVVNAARGDVGEQVWINRTRVALVTKQTPAELLLYGVDLGSGRALPHMRVQLLAGDRFVTAKTDENGVVRWSVMPRPVFALAQWGSSYAFCSPLPQSPLPAGIVGVRTASAVVRGGGVLRVAGFARARIGGVLRSASGAADVTLRNGSVLVAERRVRVDRSGAFDALLDVPSNAAPGDDAIIAQVGTIIGSATERVDTDPEGAWIEANSPCAGDCDPASPVPLVVHSSRPEADVRVQIVRSPHVYINYEPNGTPWGTTAWLDEHVMTDSSGVARVEIPRPTDGLASTYGVVVGSGGATASARIVVPTAPFAVRLHLDRETQSLGAPIGFDVYVSDVRSGKAPAAQQRVTVRLTHGALEQRRELALDSRGHARGTFSSADFGTSLVVAEVDADGAEASDAGQVRVVPQASEDDAPGNSADVSISLDRPAYDTGETVRAVAVANGSRGDALLTLESARGIQVAVAPVRDGRAEATFRALDAVGAMTATALFVRDGATLSSGVPVEVHGPGRAQVAELDDAGAAKPGGTLLVSMRGIRVPGTLVVSLSSGEPSGSALFTSIPEVLAPDVNATQSSAPQGVTWHPWVDATGAHPSVLEFVRRTAPPQTLELAESDSKPVLWRVERGDGADVSVQLPQTAGRYTLSVLDIADDGRLIAASSPIDVP